MIRATPVRRLTIALSVASVLMLSAYQAIRAFGSRTAGLSDRPMADFTVYEPETKKPVALADFQGRSAVALVFLGIDCPIGELYLPRLAGLYRSLKDRGVVFLGINSNALDSPVEVAEHARKIGVPFPVLKDVGNVVADRLRVERQCEVIVLDGQRRVRYRGAIDDQYRIGTRKGAPTHPYLADALDDVLAGREVRVPRTPVFGCLIERANPRHDRSPRPRIRPASPVIRTAFQQLDPPELVGRVTFSEHVAPILQEKCQSCHRPGQAAPFSLLTYEQARRHASMIREVVDNRRMPPWHADPRFGRFENDRSLPTRQRATLLAWIDQGAALGDPSKLPPPRLFPAVWSIGMPDVVFDLPEPFLVPAEGILSYRHFRVPTGFTEDKWVQAAEVVPGERSVVHHIIVYIDDHDPSKGGHHSSMDKLVIYLPGDFPSVFPSNSGKRIPAGADLVLEVHYTPIGVVRADRSSVGLIFTKEPVHFEVTTQGISNQKFAIPPGARNYPVRCSFTFPYDAHLISLMPHMHLRGKDFLIQATYPDGRGETLLSLPAYDFAWQSVYRLTTPKAMPKGTRIDCLAHFDNSAENPANPDPTRMVRWGEQTSDEMMVGYLDFSQDVFQERRTLAKKNP